MALFADLGVFRSHRGCAMTGSCHLWLVVGQQKCLASQELCVKISIGYQYSDILASKARKRIGKSRNFMTVGVFGRCKRFLITETRGRTTSVVGKKTSLCTLFIVLGAELDRRIDDIAQLDWLHT